MSVIKFVHNNIEFFAAEGNNSACSICKKVINDRLLFAHSITHKDDVRSEVQAYSPKPSLPTVSTQPLVKRHKKCSSLTRSLKVANKYLNKINRISLTYQRSVYLQSKRAFRKWIKMTFSE